MAIVTLTTTSPQRWLDAFQVKGPTPKIKVRKKMKGFIWSFHITHRPTAGNNGPGRKTKTMKNGAVTHLHSNRLG